MLFNSLHFAIFFPIVTLAFFLLQGRSRVFMLLLASAYFYMALVPVYILILAALIVVDYGAGLQIGRSEGHERRAWLVASLLANFGVLFGFKYWGFFAEQVALLATASGSDWRLPLLHMVLPVGLSFHTFQSVAYTIEVYYRRQEPERSLSAYALYVLFYPQLVAGPIERPGQLLNQVHRAPQMTFDAERASSGLRLMLWGMLKKVVVADGLAAIVDRSYANLAHADSVALLVGAYAFSIQIYCDFSGYTDVARGAARVMGFDLMRNFERPYESTSITEFWRRWHISLSSWFRDYLYIPLGGSRGGALRAARNVMIVFLVSGLWHGAAWSFVVWGALHGVLVVGEAGLNRWLPRRAALAFPKPLRWFLVFHLVTLAWVFFRAPNLSVAGQYLERLFAGQGFGTLRGHNLGDPAEVALAFGAAFALLGLEWGNARYGLAEKLRLGPLPARWLAYYAAALVLLVGAGAAPQQFIYFQF
jgi:D-alanyl-lipoteichoic acid acyltransferase DltB (MBOAT superfamily)